MCSPLISDPLPTSLSCPAAAPAPAESWNSVEILRACSRDEYSKTVSSSLSNRVARLGADSFAFIGNAMTMVSLPVRKALVREKVKCACAPAIRQSRDLRLSATRRKETRPSRAYLD